MHVLLAVHDSGGAMQQLKDAPWWEQLAGAAGLGVGAYLTHKYFGDSMAGEIAQFLLGLGALILLYHGIFGNS
jgi:hypothetical protein